MSKAIEVDTKTFVRFWLVILGFGLAGVFIWKAWASLMIIGISLFLTIAIRPLARRINRLFGKERSSTASVLAYAIVIGVIGAILAVVGPVVIEQTSMFVQQLPNAFEDTLGGWAGINDFGQSLGIDNFQGEITTALQGFSSGFVSNLGNILMVSVGTVTQTLTNVILTIVLTLFFSLEGPGIVDACWKAVEGRRKNNVVRAYKRLAQRMVDVVSTYVSRQVMVALLDGCVVTITVLLLAFTFGFSGNLALPMGLIAFVFYLIPMFGPIISCILITLVLLFSSPVAAAVFLVFYIIYAQVENNVIAPKVQGNALNLPATAVLVAIIIGMNMFGLIGAIIAIPIAGCIKVLFEEWPQMREANIAEAASENRSSQTK